MTVAQALRESAARLAAISDTARLDAELLMAHALGVGRSDMLLRCMDKPAPDGFAALIERRAAHEPVAYITGVQEFYGRDFAVRPGILIPRGDSETLIEAALAIAPEPRRVLDLGTGSGALLVTMLAECPRAAGIGIDASPVAIAVAGENAAQLGLERDCAFQCKDWCAPDWTDGLGRFDLILCNPPYVETGAVLDAQVRNYEPAEALYAGEEGLDDYRAIFPQLRDLMEGDAVVVVEIGASQAAMVSEIAQSHGFAVEMHKDLANRPRCVVLRSRNRY